MTTAGCGLPPAPELSPQLAQHGSSARPAPAPSWTPSPVPSPAVPSPAPSEPPRASGPGEPVGDARVTAADGPLLEAVRRDTAPDVRVPGDGSVIVIHREPAGDTGELAWMPDDRSYCLAVVREARASTTCNPLPKSWARIGIRLVTEGAVYPGRTTVYFAVVDGGHAPYAYAGRGPHRPDLGPVREATASFAPGRTLSLLTYERPVPVVSPGDRDICSADNAVCFPALDAYVPGSP
ncbi:MULTISPECIES: hypothetical protein [unclassified Streptomyces]|uniref:hypothetical protein n=1 Tax=unclassified Streptomyces TaxID=2593676 RepID=UPI0004BD5EF3|nr:MULTISPECIES: hypothetical protein [unclassified Streptomyces]